METMSDVVGRLLPSCNKNPARFLAFHSAVWLMCRNLKEGAQFRIADRCVAGSIELFRDVVKLCIMEEPFDAFAGQLELSDDMEYVRRTLSVRPNYPVYRKRWCDK